MAKPKPPRIFRAGVTLIALGAIVALALGASQITRYTIEPTKAASSSSSASTSSAATDDGGPTTGQSSVAPTE